jgi:hypothetical protein
LHYWRRIGVLEPKPVSISEVAELLSGNGGSELAVHRTWEFKLAQNTHIRIDVIYAIVALFIGELVEWVSEDLVESCKFVEPKHLSKSVVITHSMIATANGVNGKEVKIAAHNVGRDISKLVNIVQCTSLC